MSILVSGDDEEALHRDVAILGRAYGHGFISHDTAHHVLRELLGLPQVVKKQRPSLPIYYPPEYYWRECECGRQGQRQEDL